MPCQGLSLRVLIAETGAVSERLRVREIDDDEGRRLVRIIRRGSGSVVTWRRAQMVLLSAQGMDVSAIVKVAFTSEDRVRDVIRNFNADGFGSLYPKYRGGRPPKFTLGQRREIKKIAKAKPIEYDLPFSALEPGQAGRLPGGRGGGRRHQPRGPSHHAPRGGRPLSTDKNLEDLQGPALRGEEAADRAPVRDRRPRGDPAGRRARGDLLRR